MCGRFTIGTPEKIPVRFKTSNKMPLFDPSWNIAPSRVIPTITRNSPNQITMMKWGLEFGNGSPFGTINIRSESCADKPFFKHLLLSKRCLIVADSFYEWGVVNLEGKDEKYPFNFFLKDRKLFGFAGLYNEVEGRDGKPKLTCAILTTMPNETVKKVHHRMPVILKEEDEDIWLNPENNDFDKLFALLKPYDSGEIKMQIVSKRVNSPGIDDEKLVEPLEKRGGERP